MMLIFVELEISQYLSWISMILMFLFFSPVQRLVLILLLFFLFDFLLFLLFRFFLLIWQFSVRTGLVRQDICRFLRQFFPVLIGIYLGLFFQKAVQGQMPVHIFSCKKRAWQHCQNSKKAHAQHNAERFLKICHTDHLLSYPMNMVLQI